MYDRLYLRITFLASTGISQTLAQSTELARLSQGRVGGASLWNPLSFPRCQRFQINTNEPCPCKCCDKTPITNLRTAPHELSTLGFGSVGSVGGNYSGTKLHSLFSAILVVATKLLLLLLLPAACVGVCESGRVCLCSALQSLLLVFSAAPTQFTVHSGMAQCKCCSEWKGIK